MPKAKRDPKREHRITMEAIVDAYGPEEQAMGWYYYLEGKLRVPFLARCITERAISPLRKGDEIEIVRMAPEEECQVAKDNTVAFHGAVLPLPKHSPFVSWAHKTVNVHVLLDGAVEIFLQSDRIARFDAKTTRTSGLHRTNGRREVSTYGPDTTTAAQRYAIAP